MSGKKWLIALALTCFAVSSAFAQTAQGADPKTVVPAWVTEKQIAGAQTPAQQPAQQTPIGNFNLFFIGYDLPTLSGSLASHLASWQSPINFSLGMESAMGPGSSMLSGIELELMLTFSKGSRMLMNDMAMIGYSFDLKPVKLNIGARLGLTLLDVTDDASAANTYTALGGLIGPEASLYVSVAPGFWIWARGRYTFASYFSLDNNAASPVATGSTDLNCLSLEAGLAFKM